MASVVCQGLQSCLEPPLTESSVLTHKSFSKPTQVHQKPILEVNVVIDNNVTKNKGWTFLKALENPSLNLVKNEEVYVHPMAKRSASALSSMSLEMCTESLGTETGSDVSESIDEFNWEDRENYRSLMRSKARAFDSKMLSHRKGGGSGFPPPLTSISGSDGTVKVKPHREGGRLVIKAVSVSDCGTKFEEERTDGRLRLSLSKDCLVNVETGRAKMKNMGNVKDSCDDDVKEGGRGGGRLLEMDGNRRKVGGKTGNRLVKRPYRLPKSFDHDSTEFGLSRCKDGQNGNKGIGNWSLFRVVIS